MDPGLSAMTHSAELCGVAVEVEPAWRLRGQGVGAKIYGAKFGAIDVGAELGVVHNGAKVGNENNGFVVLDFKIGDQKVSKQSWGLFAC